MGAVGDMSTALCYFCIWSMKNEDRILELIAETLQRIDRHQEELTLQRGLIKTMQNSQNEMLAALAEMRESMVQERQFVRSVLQSHESATHDLHLTSVQQQDTMREMTQLLVAQNKKLLEHNDRLNRP